MPDKYPRVTRAQMDLWLNDPVTKNYLLAVNCYKEDVRDGIANGTYIDRTNNDLTCNELSFREGCVGAAQNLEKPVYMLEHYGLVELENEVMEDEEDVAA